MGNGMDAHSYKFWNTSQVPALPGPIPDLGEVVLSDAQLGWEPEPQRSSRLSKVT